MFTLTGVPKHRRRIAASITWDNGRLSGDSLLVREAKDNARAYEGRAIGFPGGPKSVTDHLNDPYGAAWLLGELFRPGTIQATGDIPEFPDTDPDALQ